MLDLLDKAAVVLITASIAMLFFFSGMSFGTRMGVEHGIAFGEETGYAIGFQEGNQKGFDAGSVMGQTMGYGAGLEQGQQDGYLASASVLIEICTEGTIFNIGESQDYICLPYVKPQGLLLSN